MDLPIDSGYALARACLNRNNNDLTSLLEYFQTSERRETDWLELKAACYPSIADVQKTVDQFGIAEEQAWEFHRDDCLWSVARAAIAMMNTLGGMIVIGINENDLLTPLNLWDESLKQKNFMDFREKRLAPTLRGTEKHWRSLVANQPRRNHYSPNPKIRLGDHVEIITGIVSAQPVCIVLVTPLSKAFYEVERHQEYFSQDAATKTESRASSRPATYATFVRDFGDLGQTRELKNDEILTFDSRRAETSRKESYAAVYNEIFDQVNSRTDADWIGQIVEQLPTAIRSLQQSESSGPAVMEKVLALLRMNLHRLVSRKRDDGANQCIAPTAADVKAFSALLERAAGRIDLLDEIQPLFDQLFSPLRPSDRATSTTRVKRVYYAALAFLEDLLSALTPGVGRDNRLATAHHNLPRRSPIFSGRKDEMQRVLLTLRRSNRNFYLTISGLGGLGKTTLAVEAAYRCLELASSHNAKESFEYAFENIVWLSAQNREWSTRGKVTEIPQGISSIDDVLRELLDFLAPAEGHGNLGFEVKKQRLLELLERQRTLVLIDNLETVSDNSIRDFFQHTPEPSKIIVTDRGFADDGVPVALSKLSVDDSATMLRDHICELDGTMDLPDEDIQRLAAVSGGIPRVIGWISHLIARQNHSVESCERILLEKPGDLYGSLFDWSFGQLSDRSQELMWLLYLLQHSASEALLAELAGWTKEDVREAKENPLRLKILNESNGSVPGEHLLSMDDVTRRYVSSVKMGRTAAELAAVDVARRFVDYLKRECGTTGWIAESHTQIVARIVEHIQWAWGVLAEHGDIQSMLNLVYAACPSLGHLGYNDLRLHISQAAHELIKDDQTRIEDHARLLIAHLGWVNFIRHAYTEAMQQFEAGLAGAAATNNPRLQAMALKSIGQVLKELGDLSGAREKVYHAIEILSDLGPTHELAVSLGTLSSLEREAGDMTAAIELLNEAKKLAQSLPCSDELLVVFQQKLARLYLSAGRLDEAEIVNREAERLNLSMRREAGIAYTRQLDALLLEARGLEIEAWQKCREAYKLFESIGMKREIEKDFQRMRARITTLMAASV